MHDQDFWKFMNFFVYFSMKCIFLCFVFFFEYYTRYVIVQLIPPHSGFAYDDLIFYKQFSNLIWFFPSPMFMENIVSLQCVSVCNQIPVEMSYRLFYLCSNFIEHKIKFLSNQWRGGESERDQRKQQFLFISSKILQNSNP